MAVDLKHNYNATQDRYWVNTDKFWEFQNEYDELQEEKQNPVSVELNIIVKLKVLGNPPKLETKDAFLPMTTVYGGMKGVKLHLKKKVIDTVYAWEDSGVEIQKIILNKLYVKKLKTGFITRY